MPLPVVTLPRTHSLHRNMIAAAGEGAVQSDDA